MVGSTTSNGRVWGLAIALGAWALLAGCAVVSAAGSVVSVGASAAGTVVGVGATAATVGIGVAGTAADVALGTARVGVKAADVLLEGAKP